MQRKHNFLYALGNQKLYVTYFIATLALLQQSGAQPAISLRCANTHCLEYLLPLGKHQEKKKIKSNISLGRKQNSNSLSGVGVGVGSPFLGREILL